MNGSDVVCLIGAGVIAAAVVYIFWPMWVQRLPKRKRQPMPPLKRRIPGLPVDGKPLSGKETALLIQIRCGMHDTALDPLEQSGDR